MFDKDIDIDSIPKPPYMKCIKCKQLILYDTKHFDVDRLGKYGLKTKCKVCRSEVRIDNAYNYKWVQMLPDEDKAEIDAVGISVVCTYCGSRFYPSRVGVLERLRNYKGIRDGGSFFYCTDKCKELCPAFNFNINGIHPLSDLYIEKDEKAKARALTKQSKDPLMAIQIDNDGYNHCERCGKIYDPEIHHPMELHHIDEIAKCGCKAVSSDGHILFCYECHKLQQAGKAFT